MRDKEYLEKMMELSKQLNKAAKARPYDPDAYNAVIDQLNNVVPPWMQRRRRWSWSAIGAILALILIFAWILYCAMNEYLDPIEIVEIWKY